MSQLILGHGAAGTAATMAPYVAGLARRGVAARAIDLPRSGKAVVKAERSVPVFAAEVRPGVDLAGGHSYGGRVASMVAAEVGLRGLVLFSYPLHRPGAPSWEERSAHWPGISCPVLLLTGDSDPFATPAMLELALPRLGNVELVRYPRVGHGLGPVLDDALDRAAAFITGLPLPGVQAPVSWSRPGLRWRRGPVLARADVV